MFTEQTSDAVLWGEVKKDNSQAFALLFKRYWSDAYTSAFAHLKDRSSCADLVQDTFLNIWEKRDNLNIESFKPYLQASTRYHVYKFMRAQKISPMTYTPDFEKITVSLDNATPSTTELVTFELQRELDSFLTTLPKRCYEIFRMSRMDNLSNEEIATRLEISKRTVENQLTYALKQIRVMLKNPVLIWIMLLLIC